MDKITELKRQLQVPAWAVSARGGSVLRSTQLAHLGCLGWALG